MNHEPGKFHVSGFGRGSRYFLAGFLIVAGALLFLFNLGVLPVRNIWVFWPLIVIGLGVSRIIEGPDVVIRAFGGLLTVLGTVVLLVNLEVLRVRVHDHSWPVSLLLIFLGFAMLLKILDKRERNPRMPPWSDFRPLNMGTADGFSDFSLLGSVKRRVDTADFRGGRALSVLGSLELDLRHARIVDTSQPIRLEVSTVLGESKVRVPDTWRIRIHGASVMGSYEDKTVPGNLPMDAPTLVITGHSILGSVEITD